MPLISNEQVAEYASGAMNIAIVIMAVLVAGAIIGIVLYLWLQMRRYSQFKCVIWGKDGFGNMIQTYDKAGIFLDRKTKNKRFFMKRANVGLTADKVPYIQTGKNKIVYLYRTGLKNFRFLSPNIDDKGFSINVGEEDVNWGLNAFDRGQKAFSQNKLLQYMPYIALAFVSIIILVIFIYFFQDFGVLQGVASSLSEAAKALAAANGGTMVIPA